MDMMIDSKCFVILCFTALFAHVHPQTIQSITHCPEFPMHEGHYTGHWDLNDKEGLRCILRCFNGMEPSGCSVLRKNEDGNWNHVVPTCVKTTTASMLPISGKTVAIGVVAGIGAGVAAPLVLTAAGFTAGGVAAGSIAAGIQGAATASGSLFALAQSAGAAGMALTTQLGLGGVVGGVASVATSLLSKCESE